MTIRQGRFLMRCASAILFMLAGISVARAQCCGAVKRVVTDPSGAPLPLPLIGPIGPPTAYVENKQTPAPVAVRSHTTAGKYIAWADSFSGKDSDEALQDRRVAAIFKKITPAITGYFDDSRRHDLYDSMFYESVPRYVQVIDHRYLIITGVRQHDTGEHFLLWIDAKTQTCIGAISAVYMSRDSDSHYTLMFSTEYTYKSIPSAFWKSGCLPGIETSTNSMSGDPKFVGKDGIKHDISDLVMERMDSDNISCDRFEPQTPPKSPVAGKP